MKKDKTKHVLLKELQLFMSKLTSHRSQLIFPRSSIDRLLVATSHRIKRLVRKLGHTWSEINRWMVTMLKIKL